MKSLHIIELLLLFNCLRMVSFPHEDEWDWVSMWKCCGDWLRLTRQH